MRIRLRQIVMVAHDLTATERDIEHELGVELCFRDPGVAEFGLHNALFPIGDQFLEVVSPTRAGTTAGRQLERRGGDGGYMVIVEVDDLAPIRRRLEALGTRIVFEARLPGIVGLHLHPADIGGAILSIDETDTWGEWPWAGPNWRDHTEHQRVGEVLAVTIDAADPAAMAATWAEVLGCTVDSETDADGETDAERNVVVLPDGGEIRFVASSERGDGVSGFTLSAGDDEAARSLDICNCRFDLV